jgi:hypothetical protein
MCRLSVFHNIEHPSIIGLVNQSRNRGAPDTTWEFDKEEESRFVVGML